MSAKQCNIEFLILTIALCTVNCKECTLMHLYQFCSIDDKIGNLYFMFMCPGTH